MRVQWGWLVLSLYHLLLLLHRLLCCIPQEEDEGPSEKEEPLRLPPHPVQILRAALLPGLALRTAQQQALRWTHGLLPLTQQENGRDRLLQQRPQRQTVRRVRRRITIHPSILRQQETQ